MGRKRFENMDPEKQRVLIEVASEEFAAHGFDGASLNRILEKTGMGKSSLYYYFDDKADLFTTLIERSLEALMSRLGHFDPDDLTAQTFWSELESRYDRVIADISSNGVMIQFGSMFYGLRADANLGTPTERVFDKVRHWIEIILVRGQGLGVIRQDIPNSLLIESALGQLESLDRWAVAHWHHIKEEERKSLSVTHIALFRDLLGSEGREQSKALTKSAKSTTQENRRSA